MTGTEPLIALRPGLVRGHGPHGVSYAARDTRRHLLLEPGMDLVMQALRPFQTRAQALTAIARATGIGETRAAAVLSLLDNARLLVTPDDVRAKSSSTPTRGTPLICVRAYRRPASLHRLLNSLHDHLRRFDTPAEVLIIDDDPRVDPVIADEARAFARASGRVVALLDAPARRQWLDALAVNDDPALTNLLDSERAASANGARSWNAALLMGAGGVISLLDDDYALPLAELGAPTRRVELRRATSRYLRFHDDPASLPTRPASEDWYARALSWAGANAAEVLEAFAPTTADFAGVLAEDVAALAEQRVAACVTGTWGANPWDSTVYHNMPNAPALRDLWREPFALARLNGDAIEQGACEPTFVRSAGFTPLALDARELLPFAAPHGKAYDLGFHQWLHALHPRAIALELPVALGHVPPETHDRLAVSRQALIADANVYLGARVATAAEVLVARDPLSRLRALAAICAEHAASDESTLRESVREWHDGHVCALLVLLRGALAMGGERAPAPWRDHVRAIIAANDAALAAEAWPSERLRPFRDALDTCARGAEAWAATWERARNDNARWRETLRLRA